MSHIFSSLCQDQTNEPIFGIKDDNNHERAYLDYGNGRFWLATIENTSRYEVIFTALDNCIELRKANGHLESRCEGMLTYNDTIIFVEIKARTGDMKTWAKDADKQLRNSIALIESRVNLDTFTVKRAAISNSLMRRLGEKTTERIKRFKNETGYILTIDYRIRLDL